MSIFRRKNVNDRKIESNKEQVNEKKSKNQVVCPDFSNTDFNNISPNQMEIFIRQAFELASIDEKQLIAMTLTANQLFQEINKHAHVNVSYGELNKIFENAINSGTLIIGNESVKLELSDRGEYTQFLEAISGLGTIYKNFQYLFTKNNEVQ